MISRPLLSLLLALALLFAQGLALLHHHEPAAHHDGDGHGDKVCDLCLALAPLDHAHAATAVAAPPLLAPAFEAVTALLPVRFANVLPAYHSRAPPRLPS